MKILLCFLIFLVILSFPLSAGSFTMSSANYQIITDVISAGGDKMSSTNYQVNNTLSEFGADVTRTASANYNLDAGFQAAAGTILTSTLSTNSISLGNLTASAVSSASQTITISTDAPSGYNVTIKEDGELRSGSNTIDDVSDGTVSAGSEEYGVRTSGNAGKMNSADTAITAIDQQIAASSTPATSESTTITYKAAVSSATAYGTYSHAVTFTTTVNY